MKNLELRQLVDGEKKKLQDKVHIEIEISLKQALKEKIEAENQLHIANQLMKERDMLFEEVDRMFLTIR